LNKTGQLDEAIASWRKAILLDPKYAPAHNNLGAVFMKKGKLNEAIAEYREATQLEKDFAEAHNNLGLALQAKGELDQAVAEFRAAPRLTPDDAEAHNNLTACQNLLDATRKLPDILAGKTKPADEREWLELGFLCQQPFKKHFATAARF